MNNQSFHDNTIVVSPTDPNTVIAGGVSYIRTTDGGTTWVFMPTSAHVDAADLRYQGSTLYIANDGGMWSTTDNLQTATNLNAGLVTREYYALATDAIDRNRIIAASQDNGLDRRPDSGGTAWITNVVGGDSFRCAINTYSPSVAYTIINPDDLLRTKHLGAATAGFPDFNDVSPKIPQGGGFSFAFVIDPNNPFTIYTASQKLWRSTDGGDVWAPLPTTTTDGSVWGDINDNSAIAIAPGNSSIIMLAKAADVASGGGVFHSTDGGTSWARSAGPTAFPFLSLAFDPRSSNIAYGAENPMTGEAAVMMTTDFGVTWSPRATGIPSALVGRVVRVDPLNSATLYCGTDAGVYRSTDQGLSWSTFGSGLPSLEVTDMQIFPDGTAIRVSTYGRGVWEIQLPTTNTPPVATITNPAANVTVTKGTTLTLQGTVSDADAGDSADGFWAFSDAGLIVPAGTGSVSTTYTFNKAGIFPIALTARDTHQALGSSVVTVSVDEPFDDCATPLVIPGSGPFPLSINSSNEAATTQSTDPNQCATNENSLWFQFTPTASATYQFTIPKNPFNPGLFLSASTGSACGPYTAIPGACGFGQMTVPATAGVTLRVLVTSLGQPFTLIVTSSASPCSFQLGSTGQSFGAPGGTASVDVTAGDSCSWNATSNAGWISIYGGASETGSGTVFYSVQPSNSPRSGTITIAGQTYTVMQSGAVGPETVGIFAPSTSEFFLHFTNASGPADLTFQYGPASSGWIPVIGDWTGQGIETVGLYNPATSVWFLKNSNSAGAGDLVFQYGPANSGWMPVVGDWDGNGTDTVGLYDPVNSVFFLKNSNSAGAADLVFQYGPANSGWTPVVGDWDGNATDTVGLYNPATSVFFLKNSNAPGAADLVFQFGPANSGWTPVIGDWNADGMVTIGLFVPSSANWFLRNSNSAGAADLTFNYGFAGGTPLAGRWH
jgi:hypothetical protein